MTKDQIAASRDYNYCILWRHLRQNGKTPAQIVEEHEKVLASWYDREFWYGWPYNN